MSAGIATPVSRHNHQAAILGPRDQIGSTPKWRASAAPQLAGCDAVMLAQFSTARAHAAVAAVLDCPVLTSPDSAVLWLRRSVTTAASSG